MNNEKKKFAMPKTFADRFYWLSGLLAMKLARFLFRLPKPKLLSFLRAAQKVIRSVVIGKSTLGPIGEIREVIENDPEGGEAIRRIVLEGRDAQFHSFLTGLFKHQFKSGIGRMTPVEFRTWGSKKCGAAKLKVGILGERDDTALLVREYEDRGCTVVFRPNADRAQFKGLLKDADGLEIVEERYFDEEILSDALADGLPVSVHHSCVTTPNQLRDLFSHRRRTGTPVRLLYPHLYYPPVRLVKSLCDGGEIGEVSTVRVRATVGATGGGRTPVIPIGGEYLAHPAFDHFLLVVYLGGRIEKVAAYLNAMDRRTGGQGLVNFKYGHPGRYGLLECTSAPDMYIWSDLYPYDLDAEIAGTDGIIWLRRGMAKRTQSAPVYMRAGKKGVSFGVESGFSDDWSLVYRDMADRFIDMIKGKEAVLLSDAEMISAVEARNAAYASSRERKVAPLS